MTETTATTPTKENEVKPGAGSTANGVNAKKYEGEGVPFKAKLIGMEDLSVDRDEKICLDSMFKLKAVVRARGEHKQRVQLNLTMSAVKIVDDTTKAQIASHEIERISFVVIDPRDTRAFGYIYNTNDDRHQFWAIKTERAAAVTVLALKELFELAFEQFTNAEKVKTNSTKTTTVPVSPPEQTATTPTNPPVQTAPVVAPPENVPVSLPPLQIETVTITPIVAAPQTKPESLLEDLWGDSPVTTNAQTNQISSAPIFDLFGTAETVTSAPAKKTDSLVDMFDGLSTISTPPTAPSTFNNSLSDVLSFTAPTPAQQTVIQPSGFYPMPTQPTNFNTPLAFNNQTPSQPMGYTSMPLSQSQSNVLTPTSTSPVAPATVSNPFSDFNFLGGMSSNNAAKSARDLFSANTPPPKTIQQMQMQKQP